MLSWNCTLSTGVPRTSSEVLIHANAEGARLLDKEWFECLGAEERLRVRIWDAPSGRVYHVGLEIEVTTDSGSREWRVVCSYDCCHGQESHGHRHHADGTKSSMSMPRLDGLAEAVGWARKDLPQGLSIEKERFEREMEEMDMIATRRGMLWP